MDQANPTAPAVGAAQPGELSPAELAAFEKYVDAHVGALDALTNLANAIAQALRARKPAGSAEQPGV